MKIETQSPAPEYNQEVQVKMTLSEFKTILCIVASITPNEIEASIEVSKAGEITKFLNDNIEPKQNLSHVYRSMKDQYVAIPKKPKFQPITFTIESEEELIALRVGTGRISGSIISTTLYDLGVRRKHDEVDQISNANYAMFGVFDEIFEGQVK